MKSTDWMLFSLTFLTGLLIGASVYILSFKPTYAPEGLVSDEDSAMEFSVIGKTYGGDMGPNFIRPSFRLLADGSYAYIPGGEGDSSLEPVEGTLSSNLMNSVRAVVDESLLREAGQPAEKETCRVDVDGFDFQYQIIVEGTLYQLDTCRTNLSYDSDIALIFDGVWTELNGSSLVGSNGAPTSVARPTSQSSGNSLQETARDWLKSRLDPTPND